MVQTMLTALAAVRRSNPYQVASLERLRQAGYADSERRPRHATHWTNR